MSIFVGILLITIASSAFYTAFMYLFGARVKHTPEPDPLPYDLKARY